MPATMATNLQQNRILAELTSSELARLKDDLEPVLLQPGQVLCAPGEEMPNAFFPAEGIVSLIMTSADGSFAELALTGSEGVVGIPLLVDQHCGSLRAVAQTAGQAFRLRSDVMRWELDQGGNLHRLCQRYALAIMVQMAHRIVCLCHHTVEQQLCRWLLDRLDRQPGNKIAATQKMIAGLLGVRREAVNDAIGSLQDGGVVSTGRGWLMVDDRPALETRVCVCRAAVARQSEQLFKSLAPARDRSRPRPNGTSLHQRAEARLRKNPPPEMPAETWDMTRLVHELQVHRIELEIQNEELLASLQEAESLRARYADVFDFSAVSQYMLDPHGVIQELNMAGAILLGIRRSDKGRYAFVDSVALEARARFRKFFADAMAMKSMPWCEFPLSLTTQRAALTVMVNAVADEDGTECRLVVFAMPPRDRRKEARVEAVPGDCHEASRCGPFVD